MDATLHILTFLTIKEYQKTLQEVGTAIRVINDKKTKYIEVYRFENTLNKKYYTVLNQKKEYTSANKMDIIRYLKNL